MILEEAAYCDPGFFYETVAPLLLIGRTSLLAISTLTSSHNFYSRLFKMKDQQTGRPIFHSTQIQLACATCISEGVPEKCVHMLHLVPSWQSSARHERLKVVMEDRPDLIKSELAGLAFDGEQSIFREEDIERLFALPPYPSYISEDLFIMIDPAAGGPSSDYAFLSFCRYRGMVRLVGGEVLSGSKDPQRQFDLVADHIERLRRSNHLWINSRIIIYVERNLGHEAEHHRYALQHLRNTYFREDAKAGRVGILTTENIKHGAATLLNIMLRENRVSIEPEPSFVSRNPHDYHLRLREQLGMYSYTFKEAQDTFQKTRIALSGKIGGSKDDIVICLQLGVFFSDYDAQYGIHLHGL